ncbi:unnamed protein product, partial [Mesorhabditis belari]|uniref:Calponin-homology (CH) domain-containing protein n=1 Tax=Mesorhabditis belari TaxID=2138241 RepID=A0AAF3FQV4_9BILA
MAAGWKHFTGKSPYPELTANSTQSAFTYGSKRDRRYRMGWIQGKRDEREERNMLNWVGKISGCEVSDDQEVALEQLHDGVTLCEFLNGLNPHALNRTISHKKSLFAATENVTNFQESICNFGLRQADLFPPNELLEKRTLTGLIKTLVILKSKLAGPG